MERWRDKVAVVTGASSGIGAAIAEELVGHGCIVVGIARRKERVEELSRKLKGKLYAVKADVSKEEDILDAFKWIRQNLSPIHILVNNAGIGKPANLIEGDVEDFKSVFDTNVLGLTIATKEAVKDMIKHNVDGHVVHINSVLGHYVAKVPNLNVYPASKHAVTALTETLRNDLNSIGSKIKVTSVSPGLVETEIFAVNGYLSSNEAMDYWQSLPKLQSKDVASAVTYVLGTPPHVQVTELTVRPVGEMA
ncbi:hypothetical protein RN001_011182 [Aquatica leii]|uniref:Farnesol dehydrogenase n=1 Tax=Aquatica leii TaxID=1421715 RepID=A0AAN7PB23_9COLE|nr:hypothetical protein RN001_011182 [Aquatica leii]